MILIDAKSAKLMADIRTFSEMPVARCVCLKLAKPRVVSGNANRIDECRFS